MLKALVEGKLSKTVYDVEAVVVFKDHLSDRPRAYSVICWAGASALLVSMPNMVAELGPLAVPQMGGARASLYRRSLAPDPNLS